MQAGEGTTKALWTGFIMLLEEGKAQQLVAVFARPCALQGYYGWRLIAFDTDGKRHQLQAWAARGTDGVFLERHASDPEKLPASRVTHVGLEGLTIQGLKQRAAEAAQRARKQGLDVLLFPVVGESYPFKLTDVAGNVIDSKSMRGRIVLLDFWATWCVPCMQKMSELKELYVDHHADGFDVVGINFDEDQQTCTKTAERLGIPWRQAMAPEEKETRRLWMEAMGLQALPRLLLIDREGILRADCMPDELAAQINELMKATVPPRRQSDRDSSK